jgi:hypothetical protein
MSTNNKTGTRVIYKYDFDHVMILPKGARILSIQYQYDNLVLWAIVDPSSNTEERIFLKRATGEPLNGKEGQYITTVQQDDGDLIWHIFEGFND